MIPVADGPERERVFETKDRLNKIATAIQERGEMVLEPEFPEGESLTNLIEPKFFIERISKKIWWIQAFHDEGKVVRIGWWIHNDPEIEASIRRETYFPKEFKPVKFNLF